MAESYLRNFCLENSKFEVSSYQTHSSNRPRVLKRNIMQQYLMCIQFLFADLKLYSDFYSHMIIHIFWNHTHALTYTHTEF